MSVVRVLEAEVALVEAGADLVQRLYHALTVVAPTVVIGLEGPAEDAAQLVKYTSWNVSP